MPDLLVGVWGTPGLGWIAFAALIGGLVRGFSGFGTALIFLPVAAQFLPPTQAILALTFMDLFGPLPVLRRAWGEVAKLDLWRLSVGTAVMLPVGLALLLVVAPEVFRYIVSVLSLGMLAVLVLGLRYPGEVRRGMVYGIGGIAGFLGGIAGLPGPAVILFYMARPLPAAVIRATVLAYLFVFDGMIVLGLGVFGQWEARAMVLGLCLALPSVLGNWLGGRLFRPAYERLYRAVAYTLIAIAALSGLPFWG